MTMKIKNLDGKKFGRLTAIKRDTKKKGTYWICKCGCGKEKSINASSLVEGNTKSCGCLAKEICRTTKNGRPTELNGIHRQYKMDAKKRGYVFDLTLDDVEQLIKNNCFYCGIPPYRTYKSHRTSEDYLYNGIDRINNDVGYVKNNCVTSCKPCNRAKDIMSYVEFVNWIKRIRTHHFYSVSQKSPAVLMDELVTTLLKLWYAQEDITKSPENSQQALSAAKKAQSLNARRTALIKAIDACLGYELNTVTDKTYE